MPFMHSMNSYTNHAFKELSASSAWKDDTSWENAYMYHYILCVYYIKNFECFFSKIQDAIRYLQI